jgi:hypothetical protein
MDASSSVSIVRFVSRARDYYEDLLSTFKTRGKVYEHFRGDVSVRDNPHGLPENFPADNFVFTKSRNVICLKGQLPSYNADFVLVHGLGATPDDNWTQGHYEQYWPARLVRHSCLNSVYTDNDPQVFEKIRVLVVKHKLGTDANDTVNETVKSLYEELLKLEVGKKPIVFLGHSLGGNLIKSILHLSAKKGTCGIA